MTYGRKMVTASFAALLGLGMALYHLGRPPRTEATGTTLLFYCAAGVKPPVLAAAQKYEKEYGVTVQLQYGGSGTLLSNIQVARAGDLYLAADSSYTELAREKGLIRERLPLAYMHPVIAVAKGNPKNIKSVSDLLREDVRVSLGNPDAASIGRQTKTILTRTGQWEEILKHVTDHGVFKPTVPEVANDIKIGAVDAGIIWDATANQYPEIEAVDVLAFETEKKTITLAVVADSQKPKEALRFARYLNSTVGNALFREHGYEAVDGDDWVFTPEITFFCGAVNRRAVDDVIRAFEEREGVTVNTVYNGCGILTGQMRTIRQEQGGKGFPDTYMACDRYYLDAVGEWFQDDVDISEADMVIAVPKGNPLGISSLGDLAQPGVRIGVGQPDQCTIGILTRILLQKEGVYDQVMKNVVMQSASSSMLVPAVATKSADAVIAYATDTRAEADKVDSIGIDSDYAMAVQPFSIAKASRHKYLGRRLFGAVAAARDKFEAAGFRYRLQDAQQH
jgi:molybdate transport system substrate-binding protein